MLQPRLPLGAAAARAGRFLVAAVVSIIGSLAACAAVVAIGTTIFPATSGYDHFRFLDYAKLTVPGVAAAALAWPVVTLFSSRARRLFAWLTVLVMLGGMAPARRRQSRVSTPCSQMRDT
ncbi:hypothetical protein [Paenarthrobacter sp. PH39-S1]|uniref:hypothetical protein n=1 Tax=Paenarthrobacter sp. PH39-S1 TaxID=3046204 RepID=UPI0024BA1D54|nr:hypothetical protein [Paenarthrobacter sp. PH39-S1]MDJ0357453.1 hypothetical protein [Paenarthrobacter sp. PH39-S1]